MISDTRRSNNKSSSSNSSRRSSPSSSRRRMNFISFCLCLILGIAILKVITFRQQNNINLPQSMKSFVEDKRYNTVPDDFVDGGGLHDKSSVFGDNNTSPSESEDETTSPSPEVEPIYVKVPKTRLFHNVCFERKLDTNHAHLVLHNLLSPDESDQLDALWLWKGSSTDDVNFTTTTTTTKENDDRQKKIEFIHIKKNKFNQDFQSKAIRSRQVYWINEPTLLLTTLYTNPNHQFWDVLVNIFAWKGQSQSMPFRYWSFPDHTPCDTWLCQILPSLLKILELDNHIQPLHLQNTAIYGGSYGAILDSSERGAPILPCYRNVWMPDFSYYRNERRPIPNEADVILALRDELTKDFQESPHRSVFIYGHTDSVNRRWLNSQEVAYHINQTLRDNAASNINDLIVDIVPSLGALSFQEQCRKFWDARHIIYVHGGHTANLICARPGTTVTELSCNQNFGWSQDTKLFHKSMGLIYKSRKVPYCSGHNTNFTTPHPQWTNEFVSMITAST